MGRDEATGMGPEVWRRLGDPVARGGIARLATLPVSAISTFATTAIVIREIGPTAFAYVALIAALPGLIPFADLGLGAAVQSAAAAAQDTATDAYLHRVLVSAWRLMVASGVFVAAAAVLVGLGGWWGGLLGIHGADLRPDLVVPIALGVFGLSLPFGIGLRLLLGIERNDVAVLLGVITPVGGLVLAGCLVLAHANSNAFALVQSTAMAGTAATTLAVSMRLSGVSAASVLLTSFRFRTYRGAEVISTAAPMFVVMIGLPVALQSDRVILSHRSTANALAEYAVAAQVYATIWSVIYSAGVSLWPRFVRLRSRGESVRRPWKSAIRTFLIVGFVGAIALTIGLPFYARFASADSVAAPLSLTLSFAALLIVQAAHMPSAMLLSTPRLLGFQAKCVLAMLVINLPSSWILAGKIGAAGPVLGSVLAIALAQLATGWRMAAAVVKRPSTDRFEAAKAMQQE